MAMGARLLMLFLFDAVIGVRSFRHTGEPEARGPECVDRHWSGAFLSHETAR